MADAKRIDLKSLPPDGEKISVKKKIVPEMRINVELTEPDSNTHSIFNYKSLVKNELKTNGKIYFADGEIPEGENSTQKLASYFEDKYGCGRKNKVSAFYNYSDYDVGYDESDSFIDNSEAYECEIPEDLDTYYGGYYLNSGELKFKRVEYIEPLSSDEEDNIVAVKKKVVAISDEEIDLDEKPETKIKDSKTNGKPNKVAEPAKSQVSKVADPLKKKMKEKSIILKKKKLLKQAALMNNSKQVTLVNNSKQVSLASNSKQATLTNNSKQATLTNNSKLATEKHTDVLKKKVKKRPSVGDKQDQPVAKKKMVTVKDMLEEKKIISQNSVGDQLKSLNTVNDVTEPVVSESKFKNGLKISDERLSSADESSDSESANKVALSKNSKENEVNCKENGLVPSQNEKWCKLPNNLPEDIVEIIDEIKEMAKLSELKLPKSFFSNNLVKKLLLKLGSKTLLTGALRSKIYTHLAYYLPCRKFSLLKQVRQLCVEDEEKKINEAMTKLKSEVQSIMPAIKDTYIAICKKISDEENLGDPEKINGLKRKEIPKKEFPWTSELRGYLKDIVLRKIKCFYILHFKRIHEVDASVQSFIQTSVLPFWPEGWMSEEILIQESQYSELKSVITNQTVILDSNPVRNRTKSFPNATLSARENATVPAKQKRETQSPRLSSTAQPKPASTANSSTQNHNHVISLPKIVIPKLNNNNARTPSPKPLPSISTIQPAHGANSFAPKLPSLNFPNFSNSFQNISNPYEENISTAHTSSQAKVNNAMDLSNSSFRSSPDVGRPDWSKQNQMTHSQNDAFAFATNKQNKNHKNASQNESNAFANDFTIANQGQCYNQAAQKEPTHSLNETFGMSFNKQNKNYKSGSQKESSALSNDLMFKNQVAQCYKQAAQKETSSSADVTMANLYKQQRKYELQKETISRADASASANNYQGHHYKKAPQKEFNYGADVSKLNYQGQQRKYASHKDTTPRAEASFADYKSPQAEAYFKKEHASRAEGVDFQSASPHSFTHRSPKSEDVLRNIELASPSLYGNSSLAELLIGNQGLRSPYEVQRSPFEGQRSPFKNQPPQFEGHRSPFEGQKSPFESQRSPFESQGSSPLHSTQKSPKTDDSFRKMNVQSQPMYNKPFEQNGWTDLVMSQTNSYQKNDVTNRSAAYDAKNFSKYFPSENAGFGNIFSSDVPKNFPSENIYSQGFSPLPSVQSSNENDIFKEFLADQMNASRQHVKSEPNISNMRSWFDKQFANSFQDEQSTSVLPPMLNGRYMNDPYNSNAPHSSNSAERNGAYVNCNAPPQSRSMPPGSVEQKMRGTIEMPRMNVPGFHTDFIKHFPQETNRASVIKIGKPPDQNLT